MSAVRFESVTKSYSGKPAAKNVSLAVEKGERLTILGPSGCGKTTLLRLLAGFLAPEKGSILIDSELVARDGRNLRPPEERKLGMVFQDLALWPHLTVRGNLEFGLRAQGLPRLQRRERISEMLRLVQMEASASSRIQELSGGQQQRVALARAIVLRPKALLMDEPLSNLDYDLNLRLREEILRLHGELGFTLLYVTHDRDEAFDIGTRVVVMARGELERIGAPEEIREHFHQLSHRAGERSA